jgi:DNA-binding transcriptional LysR family regulator
MPKGELKIACSEDRDITDVLRSIVDFRSRHPNIDTQLDSAGFKLIENGLRNNYYDTIITTLVDFNKSDEYEYQVVIESPSILLFSANHVLSQKNSLSIADFKNETFYVLSEDEKPMIKTLHKEYCVTKGFAPQFQEFPNHDSIFLALTMGSGCALLDGSMRIRDNTAYKWLELDFMVEIGFVWKKTNANPALRLFLDEVIFP